MGDDVNLTPKGGKEVGTGTGPEDSELGTTTEGARGGVRRGAGAGELSTHRGRDN
jgi:hypothetical protein